MAGELLPPEDNNNDNKGNSDNSKVPLLKEDNTRKGTMTRSLIKIGAKRPMKRLKLTEMEDLTEKNQGAKK